MLNKAISIFTSENFLRNYHSKVDTQFSVTYTHTRTYSYVIKLMLLKFYTGLKYEKLFIHSE